MTAGEMFHQVCGTKTRKVAQALATQVANLQVWQRPDTKNPDDAITMVTSFLTEIGPRNGLEAMLAVQMIAVHEAATWFLHRRNVAGQTFQGADANVLRATRLMRLFNEQLEAMAKLKGHRGSKG